MPFDTPGWLTDLYSQAIRYGVTFNYLISAYQNNELTENNQRQWIQALAQRVAPGYATYESQFQAAKEEALEAGVRMGSQGPANPVAYSQWPSGLAARWGAMQGSTVAPIHRKALQTDDYNREIVPETHIAWKGREFVYPLQALEATPLAAGGGQLRGTFKPEKLGKRLSMTGVHERAELTGAPSYRSTMLAGERSLYPDVYTPIRGFFPIGGTTGTPGTYQIEAGLGPMRTRAYKEVWGEDLEPLDVGTTFTRGDVNLPGSYQLVKGGAEYESPWWDTKIIGSAPIERGTGQMREAGYGFLLERTAPLAGPLAGAIKTAYAKGILEPVENLSEQWLSTTGQNLGIQLVSEIKDPGGLAYAMFIQKFQNASPGEKAEIANRFGISVDSPPPYGTLSGQVMQYFAEQAGELVTEVERPGFIFHESQRELYAPLIYGSEKAEPDIGPGMRSATLRMQGVLADVGTQVMYEYGMKRPFINVEMLEQMRSGPPVARRLATAFEQEGAGIRSSYRALYRSHMATTAGYLQGGKYRELTDIAPQVQEALRLTTGKTTKYAQAQAFFGKTRGIRGMRGTLPIHLGEGVYAPAPHRLQQFSATGVLAEEEVSKLQTSLYEAMRYGALTPGSEEHLEALKRYTTAQEEIVKGERFAGRLEGVFADTRKTWGGVGFGLPGLSTTEAYIPSPEFGGKVGYVFGHPTKWGSGLWDPKMQVRFLSGQEVKERGGNPNLMYVPELLAQSLGRDTDADLYQARWMEKAVQGTHGEWLSSEGTPLTSSLIEKRAEEQANRAFGWQNLQKEHIGWRDDQGGVRPTRAEAIAELQQMWAPEGEGGMVREFSLEQARKETETLNTLYNQIGPGYQTMRDALSMSATPQQVSAVEAFHDVSHGITQMPQRLPAELAAIHRAKTYGEKGWEYNPYEDKVAPSGAGAPGFYGLMDVGIKRLMDAYQAKHLTAEQVAPWFAKPGQEQWLADLIKTNPQFVPQAIGNMYEVLGPSGTRDVRASLEEELKGTLWGRTMGPRLAERALYERLEEGGRRPRTREEWEAHVRAAGITPEFGKGLLSLRELQRSRGTVVGKNIDPEEYLRSRTIAKQYGLISGSTDWLGSFQTAYHQEGNEELLSGIAFERAQGGQASGARTRLSELRDMLANLRIPGAELIPPSDIKDKMSDLLKYMTPSRMVTEEYQALGNLVPNVLGETGRKGLITEAKEAVGGTGVHTRLQEEMRFPAEKTAPWETYGYSGDIGGIRVTGRTDAPHDFGLGTVDIKPVSWKSVQKLLDAGDVSGAKLEVARQIMDDPKLKEQMSIQRHILGRPVNVWPYSREIREKGGVEAAGKHAFAMMQQIGLSEIPESMYMTEPELAAAVQRSHGIEQQVGSRAIQLASYIAGGFPFDMPDTYAEQKQRWQQLLQPTKNEKQAAYLSNLGFSNDEINQFFGMSTQEKIDFLKPAMKKAQAQQQTQQAPVDPLTAVLNQVNWKAFGGQGGPSTGGAPTGGATGGGGASGGGGSTGGGGNQQPPNPPTGGDGFWDLFGSLLGGGNNQYQAYAPAWATGAWTKKSDIDELKVARENLDKWGEKLANLIDSGAELDKSQVRLVKQVDKWEGVIDRVSHETQRMNQRITAAPDMPVPLREDIERRAAMASGALQDIRDRSPGYAAAGPAVSRYRQQAWDQYLTSMGMDTGGEPPEGWWPQGMGGGGRGGRVRTAAEAFFQQLTFGGAYFKLMAAERILGRPVRGWMESAGRYAGADLGFSVAMGAGPEAFMATPMGQIAAYQAQAQDFSAGMGESALMQRAGFADLMGNIFGRGSSYAAGRALGPWVTPVMQGAKLGLYGGVIASAAGTMAPILGETTALGGLAAGIGAAAGPIALGIGAAATLGYAGMEAWESGGAANLRREMAEMDLGHREGFSPMARVGMGFRALASGDVMKRALGETSPQGMLGVLRSGIKDYEAEAIKDLEKFSGTPQYNIQKASVYVEEMNIEGVSQAQKKELAAYLAMGGITPQQITSGQADAIIRQMGPMAAAGILPGAMNRATQMAGALGVAPGAGLRQYWEYMSGLAPVGQDQTVIAAQIAGGVSQQLGFTPGIQQIQSIQQQLAQGVPSWLVQSQTQAQYGISSVVGAMGVTQGSAYAGELTGALGPLTPAQERALAGTAARYGNIIDYEESINLRAGGKLFTAEEITDLIEQGQGRIDRGWTTGQDERYMEWYQGRGLEALGYKPGTQAAYDFNKQFPNMFKYGVGDLFAYEEKQRELQATNQIASAVPGTPNERALALYRQYQKEGVPMGVAISRATYEAQKERGMGLEGIGLYTGERRAEEFAEKWMPEAEDLAGRGRFAQALQMAGPIWQQFGGDQNLVIGRLFSAMRGPNAMTPQAAASYTQLAYGGPSTIGAAMGVPGGFGGQQLEMRMLESGMNLNDIAWNAAWGGFGMTEMGYSAALGGMPGMPTLTANVQKAFENMGITLPKGAQPIYRQQQVPGMAAGTMGIYQAGQLESRQREWQYLEASQAYQMHGIDRNIEMQQALIDFTKEMRAISAEMRGEERSYQMQGLEFAARGAALSRRQSLESLELQERQFRANTAFQRQEMAFGWEQMQTQFGWQREDLAFNRQVAGFQYEFQMGELERGIRTSGGRERQRLLRQREYMEESFSMQEGQRGRQEQRFETEAQWQEEKFSREKAHFEEMTALQEEGFEMQRRHIEERYALEMERINAQMEHVKKMRGLEDKQRELSEKYEDKKQQDRLADLKFEKDYYENTVFPYQRWQKEMQDTIADNHAIYANFQLDVIDKLGEAQVDATNQYLEQLEEVLDVVLGRLSWTNLNRSIEAPEFKPLPEYKPDVQTITPIKVEIGGQEFDAYLHATVQTVNEGAAAVAPWSRYHD